MRLNKYEIEKEWEILKKGIKERKKNDGSGAHNLLSELNLSSLDVSQEICKN